MPSRPDDAADGVRARTRRRQEPDSSIVARAQQGDHRAFRVIVVAYQDKVHDLLARMLAGVVSLAEVEEMAQEAFLRVFRALPRFEPREPGSFTTWILIVVTRVGIDALRKRRLLQVELDAGQQGTPPARTLDPATRLYLASAIAAAVAALDVDQRMVFVLREYHDLDYEEIAEALDINTGTVKSRLSRARATLRDALEETRA